MSLYKKVLEKLKQNKEFKKTGKFLTIPYPFSRLNEYLCGIERGHAIGLLGASGAGKSKLTRYIFLYSAYKFYKETGYDLRIILFTLEDSKEKVYNFLFCNYLKEYCNINISVQELTSKSRELPDFVLDAIVEAETYFSNLEKVVTFIDGITEPTQLYETCKNIALKLGTEYEYEENIEGEKIKQVGYESPTHVLAIFDNMSNIDTEDGTSNEQAAILKFVKEYMRLQLCNHFKWSCLMVMQQDFESERQTFNKDGGLIIGRLEPSLATIGDSKRAARSFHLILGLFNPSRYEILRFPIPPKSNPKAFYDIDILGNRFRSLRILKANDTDVGMRIGLYFNGMSEVFDELPPPDSDEMQQVYSDLSGKPKFQKVRNQLIFEEKEEEPLPF